MPVVINGTTGINSPGETVTGPFVINGSGQDQFRFTDGTQNLYMDTDSNGVAIAGGPGQTLGGVYLYNSQNAVALFTNSALRVTVDSSGRMTNPYQPAFSAINGTDFVFPSGGGSKLTFGTALINIGSCYSTSTGRFTAPATGLYEIGFGGTVFSSGSDQYPTGFFYKNGSPLNSGCRFRQFFTASGQYTSIGGSQYVQLVANDYIEYYVYSASGNANGSGNEFQIFARLIG